MSGKGIVRRMSLDLFALFTDAVTSGVVTGLNCRVGDRVRKDDVLAEVETDKATLEVGAPADGVIEAVHVAVGERVDGSTPIARLAPRSLGDPPSERQRRAVDAPARGVPSGGVDRGLPLRCRFCRGMQVAGRHDCPRCGAPF